MLRSLHILIIFNIIISSNGIMIFEHICKKQGISAAVFTKPKSCCGKKHKTVKNVQTPLNCKHALCAFDESLTKTPCCRDSISFAKETLNWIAGNYQKLKPAGFHKIWIPLMPAQKNIEIIVCQKWIAHRMYKPPPPAKGKLFELIHSYRC